MANNGSINDKIKIRFLTLLAFEPPSLRNEQHICTKVYRRVPPKNALETGHLVLDSHEVDDRNNAIFVIGSMPAAGLMARLEWRLQPAQLALRNEF